MLRVTGPRRARKPGCALRRCAAGRFFASTHGIAAVEFALLLPLLLLIFFGITEVGAAIVIKNKVRTAASTVAAIANQYTTITNSDVNAILSAATAIIAPYPSANASVVLTQVTVDTSGKGKVVWSEAQNGTARTTGSTVTVPSSIGVANTVLLLGEVNYNYVPAFGYALSGSIALQDILYATPRSGTSITRSP